MKKIRGIMIALITIVIVGIGVIAFCGYGFTIGRLYKTDAKYMLINDKEAMYVSIPDRMENKMNKLSVGDEILVVHRGVEESFPARTRADFVFRLSMGDETDIPQGTLDRFIMPDAGLDSNVDSDMLVDVPASVVECKYEGYWFTLQIPEDWEYEIQEFTEEDYYDFGLYFWPKGEKEGRIEVLSTEMFAVCGTGLETKKVMFGDFEANQGTYDGKKIWDFMTFTFESRDFVALTYDVESWWSEYGEEAMNILSTIEVYDEHH